MPDDNSELTITLYIDGEVARTVKKKGKGVLVASIDYSFLEP